MKRFAAAVIFWVWCLGASAGNLPSQFNGIWATSDSVFDQEFFISGTAVYLDEKGNGILFHAPPSLTCQTFECTKPAGMLFQASVETQSTEIIFSGKDMSGKIVSGPGWAYDAASDTLRSKVPILGDKTLVHHAGKVTPAIMELYLSQLKVLAQDVPTGFNTYVVPSKAMEPTLKKAALVLVDMRAYQTRLPERTEIVAYENSKKEIYLHRVAALPGDTVEIKDWILVVNGKSVDKLDEDLPKGRVISRNMAALTVPDGTIFLLGDNWNGSFDSRFQGVIPLKAIVGKVFMQKASAFEGEFVPVK